jgi:hypothetical protein
MRFALAVLPALFGGPALANSAGCGENAFSFAEVVEGRRGAAGKGPITSVPDSLCADLIDDRKPALGSFNLQIGDPYGNGLRSERGRGPRNGGRDR